MTTQSGNSADDAFWRRPTGPPADSPESTAEPATPPPVRPGIHYPGPPPSTTPPPGWRPPLHVQPAPPRALPAQDHAALDAEEGSARTLTYGVGLVGGAVVLVLMCLLCSRALF
ncbi:translation initiation factor 2 [Plantactinospora sp. ZYX-F-223]|uniref:translation initiation factor 2 n=1 Tax=Plantactinospora sp. ZYX-F-223 TaxID=3144103 RepID=UPI0031FCA9AA